MCLPLPVTRTGPTRPTIIAASGRLRTENRLISRRLEETGQTHPDQHGRHSRHRRGRMRFARRRSYVAFGRRGACSSTRSTAPASTATASSHRSPGSSSISIGQVGAEPGCGRDAEIGEADDTSPSTAGCGPGNECERGVGDAAPSCGDSPGLGRYSNAGEATAGNQRAEELVERDEPTALPDTGRAGAGSVHQPGGSSVGEPQFALVSEL